MTLLSAERTAIATSRADERTAAPDTGVTVAKPRPVLAYLAGKFPCLSETFVYREVRALRQAGWRVRAVSLAGLSESDRRFAPDLTDGTVEVYGQAKATMVRSFFAELAAHPGQALRTLRQALGDALFPGETTALTTRAKLLVQAVAGIGIARTLRRENVSHLHCHFAHAPTSVGMYAAMQLGIPFSFTGHANDLFQRRALLIRKLERAAFVSCISEWHRELYVSQYPAGAGKYVIVRCGVDTRQWEPTTIQAGDVLRVLTVCRLVEKKGVDTLIHALAELPHTWQLTIAGDGPERQNLQDLAKALGCADRVTFLGSVPNERVAELLAETDIFSLICRTDRNGDKDGIPVVLMEAMACGLPVIAGDLPAIRELVEHDVSGLLVEGADASAVAVQLRRLTEDASLRKSLGQAGRLRVEQEFSLAMNINRLTSAIQEAVAIHR